MRILGLVPARSGSKGIKDKNTRDFCGKPLLIWAVDVALETCTKTVVTSDNLMVRHLVPRWVKFLLRPMELATDDAPMLPVVQHALTELLPWEPGVVVLLQPTQPLRTAEHIFKALALLAETGADSVVSVVEIPAHYSPDFALRINDANGHLYPFHGSWQDVPTQRQDCRPAYSRDGTVYAVRREVVLAGSLYGVDCRPLIIPHSESVNLDTEADWAEAAKRI